MPAQRKEQRIYGKKINKWCPSNLRPAQMLHKRRKSIEKIRKKAKNGGQPFIQKEEFMWSQIQNESWQGLLWGSRPIFLPLQTKKEIPMFPWAFSVRWGTPPSNSQWNVFKAELVTPLLPGMGRREPWVRIGSSPTRVTQHIWAQEMVTHLVDKGDPNRHTRSMK